MTYEYPRGLRGPIVSDVALVFAWSVFAAVDDVPAGVRRAMLVAIPVVLLWGLLTLHLPSRVVIDAEAVTFERYGRAHRYRWEDVRAIRVRRFLVRDRVLVRVDPSGGAWRGRYWLLDTMEGFRAAITALESPPRPAGTPGARLT
jgi:hypothetical protein